MVMAAGPSLDGDLTFPEHFLQLRSGEVLGADDKVDPQLSVSLAHFLCQPLIKYLQQSRRRSREAHSIHSGAARADRHGTKAQVLVDKTWEGYLLTLKIEIDLTLEGREDVPIEKITEQHRTGQGGLLSAASEGQNYRKSSQNVQAKSSDISFVSAMKDTIDDDSHHNIVQAGTAEEEERQEGRRHLHSPAVSFSDSPLERLESTTRDRHGSNLSILHLPPLTKSKIDIEKGSAEYQALQFVPAAHPSNRKDVLSPQRFLAGMETHKSGNAVNPSRNDSTARPSAYLSNANLESGPHQAVAPVVVQHHRTRGSSMIKAAKRPPTSLCNFFNISKRTAVKPTTAEGSRAEVCTDEGPPLSSEAASMLMAPGFLVPILTYTELTAADASVTVMARLFGWSVQQWFTTHHLIIKRLSWLLTVSYSVLFLFSPLVPAPVFLVTAAIQIITHFWVPLYLSSQANWYMTTSSIFKFDYMFIFFEILLFMIAVLCMHITHIQKIWKDSIAQGVVNPLVQNGVLLNLYFAVMWVTLGFGFLAVLAFCDGFNAKMRRQMRFFYLIVFGALLSWNAMVYFEAIHLPVLWYNIELSFTNGLSVNTQDCIPNATDSSSSLPWKRGSIHIPMFDFWINRGVTVSIWP